MRWGGYALHLRSWGQASDSSREHGQMCPIQAIPRLRSSKAAARVRTVDVGMVNDAKASETSLLIQFQPAGDPLALGAAEETVFRQCYTLEPGEYRWTRRRRIIGGTSENLNGVRCMYLEANLLDVDRVTCTLNINKRP